MYTIASIIITLCSILPPWVVAIVLSMITLVLIIILIKIISLVLDAVPFL